MRWGNWRKVMLVTSILILLFWIPVTRSAILFVLPLGSGLDDLIFFVLLILACVLLMMRAAPVRNKMHAITKWFSK